MSIFWYFIKCKTKNCHIAGQLSWSYDIFDLSEKFIFNRSLKRKLPLDLTNTMSSSQDYEQHSTKFHFNLSTKKSKRNKV